MIQDRQVQMTLRYLYRCVCVYIHLCVCCFKILFIGFLLSQRRCWIWVRQQEHELLNHRFSFKMLYYIGVPTDDVFILVAVRCVFIVVLAVFTKGRPKGFSLLLPSSSSYFYQWWAVVGTYNIWWWLFCLHMMHVLFLFYVTKYRCMCDS